MRTHNEDIGAAVRAVNWAREMSYGKPHLAMAQSATITVEESLADAQSLLRVWQEAKFMPSEVELYLQMVLNEQQTISADVLNLFIRQGPSGVAAQAAGRPEVALDVLIDSLLRGVSLVASGMVTPMLTLLGNGRTPLWLLKETVDLLPYLSPSPRVDVTASLLKSPSLPLEVRAHLTGEHWWDGMYGWLADQPSFAPTPPTNPRLRSEFERALAQQYPELVDLPVGLIIDVLRTQKSTDQAWVKATVPTRWKTQVQEVHDLRELHGKYEGPGA